jgi:hypothetical protein
VLVPTRSTLSRGRVDGIGESVIPGHVLTKGERVMNSLVAGLGACVIVLAILSTIDHYRIKKLEAQMQTVREFLLKTQEASR